MIELDRISRKAFDKKLLKVKRIWDGQEGISPNQAFNKGIKMESMDYIFIRDDGWSIATNVDHFITCNELWKKEWVEIYSTYKV